MAERSTGQPALTVLFSLVSAPKDSKHRRRHSASPPKISGHASTWTINLPLRLRALQPLIGSSERPPANGKWAFFSASTLYRSVASCQKPKHHCGITSPSKQAPLLTSPARLASWTSHHLPPTLPIPFPFLLIQGTLSPCSSSVLVIFSRRIALREGRF